MQWNDHSNLKDKHAFLSPSKYYWINYDKEKLVDAYDKFTAAEKGTELHSIAASLIKNKIRLPNKPKTTLNMYVNDCIGFNMDTEVTLYYSDNAFGTTDAINFDKKKKLLRIFDLKTGVSPASMNQLYIYVAYYCLEYRKDPLHINIETRIYQNNEILIDNPDKQLIKSIMDRIEEFDEIIDQMKIGVYEYE